MAINGISITGFRVAGLSVKPKKPLSKDSKIITWNRKIGSVFLLMAFAIRLVVLWLLPGQSDRNFIRIINNATDPMITFAVR